MRIIGYIMLHYGSEYLHACVSSLDAICERIMVYYSPKPTHNQTDLKIPNPDTEEDLRNIANSASKKIIWRKVGASSEGEHRGKIFRDCQGFDMIVTLDSDEVLELRGIDEVLKQVPEIDCRHIGVNGFINFWRSFDWIVSDSFRPIRFHNLKSYNTIKQYQSKMLGRVKHKGMTPETYDQSFGPMFPEVKVPIYHFGYASRKETVEYKINIHGHKAEWKPDWFEKWLNWTPEMERLHPTSNDIWLKADPYDKTQLPDILKKHPYYNLDQI